MPFYSTLTSCFGSPSNKSPDTEKPPRKSLESTSTAAESSEKHPTFPPPKPESYLTPPIRSESQLTKHAKLPSAERTSKSLAEAAARPRAAPIILTESDLPQNENGEVDPVKIWYSGGSEWTQKTEEGYNQWWAAVARGRGCT